MQFVREVLAELAHCLRSFLIGLAVLVVLYPLVPGAARFVSGGALVYMAFLVCLAFAGVLGYRKRVLNRRCDRSMDGHNPEVPH